MVLLGHMTLGLKMMSMQEITDTRKRFGLDSRGSLRRSVGRSWEKTNDQ